MTTFCKGPNIKSNKNVQISSVKENLQFTEISNASFLAESCLQTEETKSPEREKKHKKNKVKLENEREEKVEQKSSQNCVSKMCFLWMPEECLEIVLELYKDKV